MKGKDAKRRNESINKEIKKKNESWSKNLRSLGKDMDNEFELTGKKAEKKLRKADKLQQSRETVMIDGSKRQINFKNGEVERC